MRSAGVLLFAALVAAYNAAAADQRAVAGAFVVNLGIMPAERALRADGHADAHPRDPPGGSQHLLVTLDDRKSGKRNADAEVEIEVTDPRGRAERKRLLHTQGGGLPDHSELFVFPWSGKYVIRVIITPTASAKPVQARFVVTHAV